MEDNNLLDPIKGRLARTRESLNREDSDKPSLLELGIIAAVFEILAVATGVYFLCLLAAKSAKFLVPIALAIAAAWFYWMWISDSKDRCPSPEQRQVVVQENGPETDDETYKDNLRGDNGKLQNE